MSKASAWAAHDHKRRLALEDAREKIDAQLADNSPGRPTVFTRPIERECAFSARTCPARPVPIKGDCRSPRLSRARLVLV